MRGVAKFLFIVSNIWAQQSVKMKVGLTLLSCAVLYTIIQVGVLPCNHLVLLLANLFGTDAEIISHVLFFGFSQYCLSGINAAINSKYSFVFTIES